LLKKAPALLRSNAYGGIKTYLTYGSEGSQMIGDAQKLAGMLKADPALRSASNFMPNEDHLTILHNAVYSALQWINKPSIK